MSAPIPIPQPYPAAAGVYKRFAVRNGDDAVGSALPAWAQGLSDYEVRLLTGGTYGPTNGNETFLDCLPGEWAAIGTPEGAEDVFAAWSGGRGDTAGKRLFVHGGGHGDSANNGLYYYDFGSGSRPIGWVVAPSSLSALATAASSDTVYSDNRPTSIHTYDGMLYHPSQNRFYRFAGSPYTGGVARPWIYHYDLTAEAWSSIDDGSAWGFCAPSSGSSVTCGLCTTTFHSSEFSKFAAGASGKEIRIWNASNASYADTGHTMSGSDWSSPTSGYNSDDDLWITIQADGESGSTVIVYEYDFDWSANTVSVASRSHASHSTYLGALSRGGSIVYDAQRGSFWIFGFERHTSGGNMSTQLLEMDATTYEITAHTMTGDTINSNSGYGSYNRHVWFPDWRVICTVQHYDRPVSVIKVP